MKFSVAIIGLGLLCASSSWAGTTGNGWDQHEEAVPATEQHDIQGDHRDAGGRCHDAHGRFASCVPEGVTAKCRDGTYYMGHHHGGACSHHGGVRRWL